MYFHINLYIVYFLIPPFDKEDVLSQYTEFNNLYLYISADTLIITHLEKTSETSSSI